MKGHKPGSVSVSEQKRPLLLPQEVKELGRDRELLLYEGLRPILAWKNRYFEDPVFKKRLLPPPLRATPAALRPARNEPPDAGVGANTVSTDAPNADAPRMRPATVDDIEHIEQLTLEDFDIDFDKVKLPQKAEGELFSIEELHTGVNSFVTVLHER